jgi:3-dehydroquinate synthase
MTKPGGKLFLRVLHLETVRECPIIVGTGIIQHLELHLNLGNYSSVVIIADPKALKLYGETVKASLAGADRPVYIFTPPAGERAKSLRVVERAYTFFMENGIDRRALVCNLGGGVAGDLGGYVAATYLRGLDYIQLPTTLLAQVDAGTGGKAGVNFNGKKNLIGAFYQPRAVICDIDLLRSLPAAERRNGLAEVIKYALAMNSDLLGILERRAGTEFTDAEMVDIVTRCIALKAGVVEADETERRGPRAILNFGHTVGHAIEAASGLGERRHGEAVAAGMAAAARISQRLGLLSEKDVDRIEALLLQFGLPARCPGLDPDELAAAIRYDKKSRRGRTGWVLLREPGKGVVNQEVPEAVVKGVLEEICQ